MERGEERVLRSVGVQRPLWALPIPSIVSHARIPSLEGSAVLDGDLLLGLSGGGSSVGLDLLDEIRSLDNLTEDDVLSVQPGGDDGGDEELRTVGVGSSVGHGEEEGAIVLKLKVLVVELVSVDGNSSSSVVVGEVTSLEHKVGDDTMEDGSLVAQSLGARLET